MIIIGYPGVGKTEAAKLFPGVVIDLESSECIYKPEKEKEYTYDKTMTIASSVTSNYHDYYVSDEVKEFNTYCKIAEYLSKNNKIVLVSSHKAIQDYFCKSKEPVYVCYPDKEIKKEWIQFLRGRYITDDSKKNYNAYMRATNNFDDDIDYMSTRGFINIELKDGAFLSNILEESFKKEQEMSEDISDNEEKVNDTENTEQK